MLVEGFSFCDSARSKIFISYRAIVPNLNVETLSVKDNSIFNSKLSYFVYIKSHVFIVDPFNDIIEVFVNSRHAF